VTRRLAFWLLVGVQALVPLGMAGWNEAFPAKEHVLIKVQPVDPHDVMRGEYVALTYGITNLRAPAGTVYVRLYRDGDGSRTGDVATTEKPDGGVFIRGRSNGEGRIEYGIENFFVPEGEARKYENAMFSHRLYAKVALADDGRARLEDLVIR
jgi:uncharacterized membrane-anchored protein